MGPCSWGSVQYLRTVNLAGSTKLYTYCLSARDPSFAGGPLPWDEFVIPLD
jgi:hypothetical protein